MLLVTICMGFLCLLLQVHSFALPRHLSDLLGKRGVITDQRMMTSQILRGDQNCGGGDKGPYSLITFTLWCAQNKAKCDEFNSPDNDFNKRALGDVSSTEINVNSTFSIREANELDKRDGWNYVPMWVMCAGPQGQDPVMYSKAQIVAAIAEAVNLFAQRLQTPPTRLIMEFPIHPSGPPYGQQYSGPYPQPGADRVLFDNCGQFAALMTHIGLDDNMLRPCWEVDSSGRPIHTPGVPGSNPNPPPIVGQNGVGNLPIGEVPLSWLGLPPYAPYPNPGTKFP